MSPRRSVGVAAALAACVAMASSPARAWCPTTTQRASAPGECVQGQPGAVPLRWASLCAGYSLYRAGEPELDLEAVRAVARDAAARWHMPECDPMTHETPYFTLSDLPDTWAPTGYNPHDTNANTVSFNGVWRPDAAHQDGSIAITIVTFDTATGEILDADVEMNRRTDDNPDGFIFTTGMPQMDSADLPTILTHEFGHFHGIAHSGEMTAVMWYQAGLGEARQNLTSDDIQAICTTYPESRHPDAPRVCNPTPFGGLALTAVGSKSVGGCAVSASPGRGRAGLALRLPAALLALFVARAARRRRARQGALFAPGAQP